MMLRARLLTSLEFGWDFFPVHWLGFGPRHSHGMVRGYVSMYGIVCGSPYLSSSISSVEQERGLRLCGFTRVMAFPPTPRFIVYQAITPTGSLVLLLQLGNSS